MIFGVRLLAARSRTKIGLALGCSLMLWALNVASQVLPDATATRANALSNPFAATPKPELPPLPKISGLPSLPPAASPPRLPTDLRALLISESGTGLLGTSKEGAASIWVTHGKSVRIGEQDVFVEIGKTSIRLYSASKGKLLWEGRLREPESTILPADLSQKRYVPPLSAGVNPGLGQARSTPSVGGQ
jgi:hypothetical protein